MKDKFNKVVATGLIALMISSFTACEQFPLPVGTSPDSTSAMTTPTDTSAKTPVQIQHSDTYINAKQFWGSVWDSRGMTTSVSRQNEFQMKGLPFRFLKQEGAVYEDNLGIIRAYGNEDFTNNHYCIITRGYIDTSTSDYDFYLLVQYVSAPIKDLENNHTDGYVATWMLKYNLPKECYEDVLLLAGDFRLGLLIQQIDEEYKPEVISKSVVDYDLLTQLRIFDYDEVTFDWLFSKYTNYIENIDYNNMTLTVNYNSEWDKGVIYSYTYKLKESENWDKCLNNKWGLKITEEYRNALTPEQLMPTYYTRVGNALDYFGVPRWISCPSEEQKATAKQKYQLTGIGVDGTATNDKVNEYESGELKYEQVNNLTKNYSQSKWYGN